MPDVTAGSDEGVLAAWLVEESARFDAAQTIAYVETEDELFSVEAGSPRLLLTTLVEPGTRVATGTPIGVLGEPWEAGPRPRDAARRAGLAPRSGSRKRPGRGFGVGPPGPAVVPAVGAAVVPTPLSQPMPTVPLEPSTRARVPGTSPWIPPSAAPRDPRPSILPRARPGPTARRSTDAAVVEEPHHHYLRARVRADRLVALSSQLERERPDSGVTDLVDRAVLAAHRQVPQLAVAHTAAGRAAPPRIPVSHPGRFGVEEAVVVVPTGHSAALAVGG